jgi:phosphoribosylformylglycinamidine synthase subunit PurS
MGTNAVATEKRWIVDVLVMPKEGVNNPEGDAIRGGLESLGYGDVSSVRSGKYFRLWMDGETEDQVISRAEELADKLLANPVVQAFSIVSVTESFLPESEAVK